MPSSVRVTCPICHSIFEFDPATEYDKEEFKTHRGIERTVTCHKSFYCPQTLATFEPPLKIKSMTVI